MFPFVAFKSTRKQYFLYPANQVNKELNKKASAHHQTGSSKVLPNANGAEGFP
jgi:hypothetical protein